MATYYVSTTGDDNDTGGVGDPFASVDKAFETAGSGDTIEIADGTYSEDSGSGYLSVNKDFSPSGVTVQATNSGNVTIQETSGTLYVFRILGTTRMMTFNGINFTPSTTPFNNAVFASSITMSDISFVDCTFGDNADSARHNVQFAGSTLNASNISFTGCTFTTTTGRGPYFDGQTFDGLTITNCTINVDTWAPRIGDGITNLSITNCDIDSNGVGISVENLDASTSVTITNNTIDAGTGNGIILHGGTSGNLLSDLTIEDNHVASTGTICIRVDDFVSGGSIKRNHCIGNSAIACPSDSSPASGTVANVVISDNYCEANGGHSIIVSENSSNVKVLRNYSDASGGGDHAIVLKGDNNICKGNIFIGGATGSNGTAAYIKAAQGFTFELNTLIRTVGSGNACLQVLQGDGSQKIATGKIRYNYLIATQDPLLNIGDNTQLDPGVAIDHNVYQVMNTATWGSVYGTSVSSLATTKSAWSTYTGNTNNDGNSSTGGLPMPAVVVRSGIIGLSMSMRA